MRRRDIGEAGRDAVEPLGLKALGIDRDRHRDGARRRKSVPRHLVAGILHDEAVAGIEQQARADVEALLRAVDDDDLVDLAADAARPPQIALKRGPQPQRTTGIVIGEPLGLARHRSGHGLLPCQHREVRRRQLAIAKIRDEPARRRGPARRVLAQPLAEGRQPHLARRWPGCRARASALHHGARHARPGAMARLDKSFGGELLIGDRDGRARHAHLVGQRAR